MQPSDSGDVEKQMVGLDGRVKRYVERIIPKTNLEIPTNQDTTTTLSAMNQPCLLEEFKHSAREILMPGHLHFGGRRTLVDQLQQQQARHVMTSTSTTTLTQCHRPCCSFVP